MNNKFITILFGLLFLTSLFAKENIVIGYCINKDTCTKTNEIAFISDNNNNYNKVFIEQCKTSFLYTINDISKKSIEKFECAYLQTKIIEINNFIILIYNPNSSQYTHKLYYNNQISKAVLEDYTDNDNEPSTYEVADNYFYTQQMGTTLLITKKAEIDVQSVLLCSLDGRIISNLQNVGGWSQFSFDMSLEPSGMYLLRFIARERALTKRVVYVR